MIVYCLVYYKLLSYEIINKKIFLNFQHKDFNVEVKLPDGYCCLLTNSHIVLYNFPYTITNSMQLVNIDSLKCSPSSSHYYVVIVSKTQIFLYINK